MSQPVHGEFTVRMAGNIVYCDYSQGFNAAGINAIYSEILRVTEHCDAWVMLQRPAPSAGLTPEAIDAMYEGYIKLQNAGCLAVAVVDNSMFVHAVSFPRDGTLTLPFMIDKDEQALMEYLHKMREKKRQIDLTILASWSWIHAFSQAVHGWFSLYVQSAVQSRSLYHH